MAKLNSQIWALLESMVYRKEVVYSRLIHRLQSPSLELGKYLHSIFVSAWPACAKEGDLAVECDIHACEDLESSMTKLDKHGLAIYEAINENNLVLIDKLIQSACMNNNVNYLNGLDIPYIPSPLHKAALLGDVQIIQRLLAAECNVHIGLGSFELDVDIPNGYSHPGRIWWLHTKCEDIEGFVPSHEQRDDGHPSEFWSCPTPASWALDHAHPAALKVLLEADKDVDYDSMILMAEYYIHEPDMDCFIPVIRALIYHGPGMEEFRTYFERELDRRDLKLLDQGMRFFKRTVANLTPASDLDRLEEDAKSLNVLEQAMCFFQQHM